MEDLKQFNVRYKARTVARVFKTKGGYTVDLSPYRQAQKAGYHNGGLIQLDEKYGFSKFHVDESVTPEVIHKTIIRYAHGTFLTGTPAKEEIDNEGVVNHHACDKCQGSGTYIFASGKKGICFRCKGKGHMSNVDLRRNYRYDLRRATGTLTKHR